MTPVIYYLCDSCKDKYRNTCSSKCKTYIALSAEEQLELKGKIEFNGSKFGKGRYKAHNNSSLLEKE